MATNVEFNNNEQVQYENPTGTQGQDTDMFDSLDPNLCMQQNATQIEPSQATPLESLIEKQHHPKTSTEMDSSQQTISDSSTLTIPPGSRQHLPPTNSTLNSQGLHTVVIVKLTDVNSLNLINNPVLLSKEIQNSTFGTIQVKDIRVNKRKNLIIVELDQPDHEIIQSLLKVTKLGRWTVECYLPNADLYKSGVIAPVSTEADIEEIRGLMNVKGGEMGISKIERLKKKTENGWVDSESLKITFTATNIPEAVTIGHSYYKVRPYVEQPKQCYKCQRLGHTASGCRAKIRCLLCGGDHPKEQCQATEFRCANCKGQHKANSRQCNIFETAYQIEQVKATRNETYNQAREGVLSQRAQQNMEHNRNSNITSHVVHADVHNELDSSPIIGRSNFTYRKYSDTVRNLSNRMPPTKIYKSSSTQTETNTDKSNTLPNEAFSKTFFTQLKLCLIELFQSNILKESTQAQNILIESAIKNSFEKGTDSPASTASGEQAKPESRQRVGQRRRREVSDGDCDFVSSDCEGVISDDKRQEREASSEDATLWETVEKRVVKKNNKRKKAKVDYIPRSGNINNDQVQIIQSKRKNNKQQTK